MVRELQRQLGVIATHTGKSAEARVLIEHLRIAGLPESMANIHMRFNTPLGPMEFDYGKRVVMLNGREILLGVPEKNLLNILASTPNEPVDPLELRADLLWNDPTQHPRQGPTVLVTRLRQKLGEDTKNPVCIVTAKKAGYMFVGTPITG